MNQAVAPRGRSLVRRAMGAQSAVWRVDGILLVAVMALSVIGALLVWSSTRTWAAGAPTGMVKKHVLNLMIGWVLCGVAALANQRMLRLYAPAVYGAALLGLFLVITPVGSTINGSHSWILLGGGFAVQPSELAKPALVLMLGALLAEPATGTEGPRPLDLLLGLTAAAIPIGLVMLQPDFGTTVVLLVITGAVVVFAGLRKRWIVLLAVLTSATALAVWFLGLLKPYQVARFTAFVDPATDPRGAGYNSTQSLIAIGSGELFGKGLFHGGQTSGRFVPEQHTDFIFTVVGEEFGFLGSITVVALLGLVLIRGLRIARNCDERFGSLVVGGIVCWFAFQIFVNIGMTIGIMPITGVPLPFVSYGGTATFANMIAIGILQAVHIRDRQF
ncbi:rod shape-determining protein RodA [Sphaerisporangium sp. TRM90804]|uniref:rod shape-determining protein RodA n=1 Tax=Sphaerisporangium sp. TRM90804 TaxID=3031113 RepID=UPI0024484D63|nr:rod shape-determining protein RodA [Sphaerisporangium sp. TRM90804]MDH2428124.1 rod shape-determining protein RodA [Sphaerisporangium sp. TRM90804]